jgi:hypothetical protein
MASIKTELVKVVSVFHIVKYKPTFTLLCEALGHCLLCLVDR